MTTPIATTPGRLLRADLHVHSCYSTKNGNLPFLKSRDCYSQPEAVYRAAKARGMDIVTITDHDSIDGCLAFLDRHPDPSDFVIGEEVSCRMPEGDIEVHLGVYGMTEALHREIQPLRGNVFEVTAALHQAGVFFALNHLFHFYRGQVPLLTYLRLLAEVPALEVRNGTMLPAHNALVEQIWTGFGAAPWPFEPRAPRRLAAIGGSDAHTLRRVGTTWTEAPGTSAVSFIANVAAGLGRPGGAHGNARVVALDAYGVIAAYVGSLAGFGPRDHDVLHRLACLAFSVVSLPAQFLPVLIAWIGKTGEARRVEAALREMAPFLMPDGAAAAVLEAQG